MYVCPVRFCSSCRVILLSEYTRAVLFCSFSCCMYSKAFKIAICSAWLLVRRTFSLYLSVVFRFPPVKMAIPEPTPASLLLPSV